MNAILLDARGDEVEMRTVIPRRVRLTRAAVDRLAELTGVPSPVAPMLAEAVLIPVSEPPTTSTVTL